MTGLEPAASGVTVRLFDVIKCKTVAFMPNAFLGFPPIHTQNLEQTLNIYTLFFAANNLAAPLLPKHQAESACPSSALLPSVKI